MDVHFEKNNDEKKLKINSSDKKNNVKNQNDIDFILKKIEKLEDENKKLKEMVLNPSTHRRIDILRPDYIFSVIIPCLMAIYFNHLNILHHLDIIFAFALYAFTGNTLNDMIDAKNPSEVETVYRVQGYHWKEIGTIGVISFAFGTMFFIRTIKEHPINLVLLIIIVFMVVVYCIKKNIPIINQILLGASHVFFPYIMIKIDANSSPILTSGEWFLMLAFFSYAFTGQIVHEIIDGDSITKFSLRTQQLIVIVSSIITIVLGIFAMYILDNIYFFPLILIPIGSIYTFRHPTRSTKGVKDVGLILGNVILIYFLGLIIIYS
ncbi:MAG: hypothetical protein ACTSVC_09450 [Promethearchaeota archaeon]